MSRNPAFLVDLMGKALNTRFNTERPPKTSQRPSKYKASAAHAGHPPNRVHNSTAPQSPSRATVGFHSSDSRRPDQERGPRSPCAQKGLSDPRFSNSSGSAHSRAIQPQPEGQSFASIMTPQLQGMAGPGINQEGAPARTGASSFTNMAFCSHPPENIHEEGDKQLVRPNEPVRPAEVQSRTRHHLLIA